ncbi:MAG: membrane protein insertion efficiency factor YidD [Tannerellaceae bacterium]|nr:membrane protein insertion efficiency factor YidD [Tannerellaceae bacterium]
MKSGILLLIRLYWLLPESKRKRCLFRESCSRYVYRVTKEEGFIAGIKALKDRVTKCRPGYKLHRTDGHTELHLKDGTVLCEEQISYTILYPEEKF